MKRSGFSGLRLAAALGLLILCLAAAFYFVAIKAPTDSAIRIAQTVGAEFRKTFGLEPKTAVSEQIILAQTKSIVELATAQRTLAAKYDWQQTWLGSTKTIQIEGAFVAKAGFDLRVAPKIVVSGTSNGAASRVVVEMPMPRLLSLERVNFHILKDENGWWNRISDEDREAAENALALAARKQAVAAGMLADAERNFVERLKTALTTSGSSAVEVHFQNAPFTLFPSTSPRE